MSIESVKTVNTTSLGPELEVLRELDRADHVADARDAEPVQLRRGARSATPASRRGRLAAGLLVEEADEAHRQLVVDADRGVGVAEVVDPGDVLVADALDAVVAEAVLEDGRALEGFGHGDAWRRGRCRAGRSPSRGCPREPEERTAPATRSPGPRDGAEGLLHRGAGDGVVPEVVRQLVELVEDDGLGAGALELGALVEDLLDVGLAAGRRDDLLGHGLEPLEALLRHARGKDGDAGAGEEAGDVGPAAAVVARARPDRLLGRRVEAARDELGQEAGEGGADLVRPGGEPLADEADDARLGAREGARQLEDS